MWVHLLLCPQDTYGPDAQVRSVCPLSMCTGYIRTCCSGAQRVLAVHVPKIHMDPLL